jgi:tetratricopeptide (TPR) repeat protein
VDDSFRFETCEVDSPTTAAVRQRLESGRGCLVTGSLGSGKTHALRKAMNGAIWVDILDGPLHHVGLLVDLARGLQDEGILAAAAKGDLNAALARADEVLAHRWLIVDGAERLDDGGRVWDWSESTKALWQFEQLPVTRWLLERVSRSATVLVSRRPLRGSPEGVRLHHKAPAGWPLKLVLAAGGFRDWQRVAALVDGAPGGMVIARALIPLLGADEFNRLLDVIEWETVGPGEAIRSLGRELADRCPDEWARVLGLVDALGGERRDRVEAVLDETDQSRIDVLLSLGLLDEREGRIQVASTARSAGVVRALGVVERQRLLGRLAARLLDEVNDLRSLDVEQADTVFRAHRLFVQLGDFANAARTARLHLGGLIEIARVTSREERWDEARRQYERLLDLLPPARADEDEHACRTRSYVTHYRAFNGHRAGTLGHGDILAGYQEAVASWPSNALWHARLASALIEGGRVADADAQVAAGYEQVEPHPRRDWFLRILPANAARRAGAPVAALRLIEPLIGPNQDADPEVGASISRLLDEWANGCCLCEIPALTGFVYLQRNVRVQLRRLSQGWLSSLADCDISAQTEGLPSEALAIAGEQLAKETRALVATPSHLLDDRRVRRKGFLLGLVDLLHSEIGLSFAATRWFLGRLEGGRFMAVQRELLPIPVEHEPGRAGGATGPLESPGLYFALVSVHRDGRPAGSVTQLVPAGSGRSLIELLTAVRELPIVRDASH